MSTNSTTLNSNEAKIILNWDDGTFYIAENDYHTNILVNNSTTVTASAAKTTNTGGVKVPEWDQSYKYIANDIVAYLGVLYVSKQNQNQNNIPNDGTFWWNNIINLSMVDAITLQGKTISEITKDILGGNKISDYYKKLEVENLIVDSSNSINAKRLENWSLLDIKNDYTKLVDSTKSSSMSFVVDYLHNSDVTGFDNEMVKEFERIIIVDTVNQI